MNGKDKCEFLKGIRKRMAEANGIPYEPRECTFEGECTGTCPFCEKEAAELLAKLKEKEEVGAEIKTDDVGILAIEMGVNESEGSNEGDKESLVLTGADDTLVDVNVENPVPFIDPFRGSNNPFMSGKGLRELRQAIHANPRKGTTLMGDIRSPYEEMTDEDKETRALLQEEIERAERERKRGVIGKLLSKIKTNSLRGEIEEDK